MRPKIRQILEECIETGIENGYHRAHKYNGYPSHADIFGAIEDEIWLEIDRHFDFDRNICDEVVEGFDQLEKEREWVGLTWDEMSQIIEDFYTPALLSQLCRAIEAKLREKNA